MQVSQTMPVFFYFNCLFLIDVGMLIKSLLHYTVAKKRLLMVGEAYCILTYSKFCIEFNTDYKMHN